MKLRPELAEETRAGNACGFHRLLRVMGMVAVAPITRIYL